ncbi:hypothetical protein AC578_6305 [Pseudocercospora eumusae]|uniref:Rhodopsin domain-containing protein n=1 Tax=Pseudocercospora eumusae TaxID=321146 RepID=A0A139H296_9PEZI|nr:hypothetical protein AC578_6305 [Pseudocercospora eumusae]
MVFIYFQVHYGDGRHLLALTMQEADNIAKMNFPAVTLWTFAITGTKISILLQYLHLFQLRKTTRLIWLLMVIVMLGGLSTFGVIMTACIPIAAVWNPDLRSRAKCLNQRLFWQIQSAFEAATCWAMLGLLIPTMWKLQLSRVKRIGIIALLGLSSSSCISSVLRMKSAFDAIPESADEVHDFTWTGIMATIYAVSELHTAIICCSLPAMMPLRFIMCPCWFPSRRTSGLMPGRAPLPLALQDHKLVVARPILPTPSMTDATAQRDRIPRPDVTQPASDSSEP